MLVLLRRTSFLDTFLVLYFSQLYTLQLQVYALRVRTLYLCLVHGYLLPCVETKQYSFHLVCHPHSSFCREINSGPTTPNGFELTLWIARLWCPPLFCFYFIATFSVHAERTTIYDLQNKKHSRGASCSKKQDQLKPLH